jgi:hypothetical protein
MIQGKFIGMNGQQATISVPVMDAALNEIFSCSLEHQTGGNPIARLHCSRATTWHQPRATFLCGPV